MMARQWSVDIGWRNGMGTAIAVTRTDGKQSSGYLGNVERGDGSGIVAIQARGRPSRDIMEVDRRAWPGGSRAGSPSSRSCAGSRRRRCAERRGVVRVAQYHRAGLAPGSACVDLPSVDRCLILSTETIDRPPEIADPQIEMSADQGSLTAIRPRRNRVNGELDGPIRCFGRIP